MKKNILIALETLAILVLGALLFRSGGGDLPRASVVSSGVGESLTVRFPDIPLGENERITGAKMFFQLATIRAVRNIPPAWHVAMESDPPSNPAFSGSIEVGAAAVGSAQELPEFEITKYIKEEEPRVVKAIFTVAQYPGDGKEREIVVEMKQP